jgi:hypothetical protein
VEIAADLAAKELEKIAKNKEDNTLLANNAIDVSRQFQKKSIHQEH